jgi:hypothetical protein
MPTCETVKAPTASVPRAFHRLLLLLGALGAVAFGVERAARPLWPEASGPGSKERIDLSFAAVRARPYDCIIVGNSRLYRGVNPDRLGMSAYNFAQDDDAFNQIFYKLKFLETNNVRVSTLVMGVDYFQFSFVSNARNHAYAPHFPAAYLDDFPKPPASRIEQWLGAALHPIDEAAFNAFMARYFTRPASLLVERTLMRLRGEPPAPPVRTFVRQIVNRPTDEPA